MSQLFVVSQGPGKALRFIAELNELIDGDNVTTEVTTKDSLEEGQTNKGQAATTEARRLIGEMEKEEALALLGSAMALRGITSTLEEMLRWRMVELEIMGDDL